MHSRALEKNKDPNSNAAMGRIVAIINHQAKAIKNIWLSYEHEKSQSSGRLKTK